MNCKKCGAMLNGTEQFCTNCGTPVVAESNQVNDGVIPNYGQVDNQKMTMDSLLNPMSSSNNVENVSNQNQVVEQGGLDDTLNSMSSSPSMSQSVSNNPYSTNLSNQQLGSNQSNTCIPNNYSQASNNLNGTLSQSGNNMINSNNGTSYGNNVNPGVSYNQQSTNQASYYNQPPVNYGQSNNRSNVIIIAVAIVVVAILGAVVFLFGDKIKNLVGISDESGEKTSSTYTAKFKNFTMQIPEDYIYDAEDEQFLITNLDGNIVIIGIIYDGSFETVKKNKAQLPMLCKEDGFTCSKVALNNYDDVEFLTAEATISGQPAILAFSKIDLTHYGYYIIASENNGYDYSILNELAPIVKTVKYSPSGNKITVDEEITIPDLSSLAQ